MHAEFTYHANDLTNVEYPDSSEQPNGNKLEKSNAVIEIVQRQTRSRLTLVLSEKHHHSGKVTLNTLSLCGYLYSFYQIYSSLV